MNTAELRERIRELLKEKPLLLVAIDGFGGSGKSTLAAALQNSFEGSQVVHMDDFAQSRNGDTDRQRLLQQVLEPLRAGKSARYQKFDWQNERLGDWVELKAGGPVFVEGTSLLADDLYPYYDFNVWIDVPHEEASKRGMDRDKNVYKVDHDEKWRTIWIPGEKEYAKLEPWKRADFLFKN